MDAIFASAAKHSESLSKGWNRGTNNYKLLLRGFWMANKIGTVRGSFKWSF